MNEDMTSNVEGSRGSKHRYIVYIYVEEYMELSPLAIIDTHTIIFNDCDYFFGQMFSCILIIFFFVTFLQCSGIFFL